MPRPLRINCPNTYCHVLSRGVERREIFRDQSDYGKFLDLLGNMVSRFDLEIHAFVLMANHYHLLLYTRNPNLSEAMQWLGSTYATWFNKRHERSGHLFQGRFKSFVIGVDRYLVATCLYIHRNPIRSGLVRYLSAYPWSSFPQYFGKKNISWLTTSLLLGMYGHRPWRFLEAHASFVQQEKGLMTEERYHLLPESEQGVARSEPFKADKPQTLTSPALENTRVQDLDALLETICAALGEQDLGSMLTPHRRRTRPNRDLAIFILSQLGPITQVEIGRVFGISATAVTKAIKRGKKYHGENENVRERVRQILSLRCENESPEIRNSHI